MSKTKLPLNVVINKDKSKVLFAEASNYVADILLCFLALPLGKIMKLFHSRHKKTLFGSYTTLYKGLADLDSCHFFVDSVKEMLLDPKSSFEADFRKLMLDFTDTPKHSQYFMCSDGSNCLSSSNPLVSMYKDAAECWEAGKPLNDKISVWDTVSPDIESGVFTINPSSFLITDDLRLVPIVGGIIQTINSLGVGINMEGVELRSLSLDASDIINLLEFSLTSTTPLTDLILKAVKKNPAFSIRETGILIHRMEKETVSDTFKIMTLKASLQKSTNRFLFAEVTHEFVECLLSFLDVPLGSVEYLFFGKSSLTNINNLYRSVTDIIDDKFFATPDTRNRLINPKLPHGYVFKNRFFPLRDENPPTLYYNYDYQTHTNYSNYYSRFNEKGTGELISSFKSNKINYVKKSSTFIITDDLTVTPGAAKIFCILNGLGIPLSDVKEMEVQVGVEELYGILHVALTSTTALTDALINPLLKKEPKQEY